MKLLALAALPSAGVAQGRIRRIVIVIAVPLADPEAQARLASFRRRLAQHGWVEGKNIAMEVHTLDEDPVARSAVLRDLVASRPDIIATGSNVDATELTQATRTVPIVFMTAADPVGTGLVQSLTRPGGNCTGFTHTAPAMAPKWLELLKDTVPALERVGVLFNARTTPGGGVAFLTVLREAAKSLALKLIPVPVSERQDLAPAIGSLGRLPPAGLLVLPDGFAVNHRHEIIGLAAAHRVPAIYPFHYFAAAGGLMSYATDQEEPAVQLADYVDLILRGENPGELPVQSPRKYTLWLNGRTAAALGLRVPPLVLARANRVLE